MPAYQRRRNSGKGFFAIKTEKRRCIRNSHKTYTTQYAHLGSTLFAKIFIYYNLRLMRHSVNAKCVLYYYNLCFKFASVGCFFFHPGNIINKTILRLFRVRAKYGYFYSLRLRGTYFYSLMM
jgi:hypothetical protein